MGFRICWDPGLVRYCSVDLSRVEGETLLMDAE